MWETKADEALVNVTTVVKLRPVVRPGLCDTTPPYPRCVHAGYQVHDSSVTRQVRSWLLVTNLLSIGQFNGWSCLRSWLEHRLLSVKSYLNTQRTEAKFWENKQEKAISFMTPLLLLLPLLITIVITGTSFCTNKNSTKFLTAVTKKSTVFSLVLMLILESKSYCLKGKIFFNIVCITQFCEK